MQTAHYVGDGEIPAGNPCAVSVGTSRLSNEWWQRPNRSRDLFEPTTICMPTIIHQRQTGMRSSAVEQ